MDAAMATLTRPFPGPQRMASQVASSQRSSQQSSSAGASLHSGPSSAGDPDMDTLQQDMHAVRLAQNEAGAQDHPGHPQEGRRPSTQSDRSFYMQPMPQSQQSFAHYHQNANPLQPGYTMRPPSVGEAGSMHSDSQHSSGPHAAQVPPSPKRFSSGGGSVHSAEAYAGGANQDFDPLSDYYAARPPDDLANPPQFDPHRMPQSLHQPGQMQQPPQQPGMMAFPPEDFHHMGPPQPPGHPSLPPGHFGPPPHQQPRSIHSMQNVSPMHQQSGSFAGPVPGGGGSLQPSNGFPQQQQQQHLALPPGSMQPGLNRAMSSVSSLNMMSYRSPLQSSSAVNLGPSPSMPAGGPSIERKRTVSASTVTRDEPKAAITKAAIDEYRNRIKTDPDPETQFLFAKYLIEAARKVGQTIASSQESDSKVKGYKRFRDSLLQESLKIMKKLATQGVGVGKPAYADAQFFYANLLSSGSLGLAVDPEKAYHLYVQASKQNHPAATYRTAYCNEAGVGTKRDYNRAVLFYRKASALGDPNGMFKLGMILLKGALDQQKNGKEAVTWLNRAAQQADENNPQALHELAVLYENPPDPNSAVGPTVQPNEAVAADLYSQAARLGYAPSQNRLGQAFEFGHLGLPIDPRRSIGYYSKAAQRGYGHAELALSGWYLTGSPPTLPQSDTEAFLWARRAANRGLPKAEYAVGYYYETGIGQKPDVEEAKRWYMRASAQNHKKAMARLTELKRSNQVKPGRKQGRPTRSDAQAECVIS